MAGNWSFVHGDVAREFYPRMQNVAESSWSLTGCAVFEFCDPAHALHQVKTKLLSATSAVDETVVTNDAIIVHAVLKEWAR